MTKQLQPAGKRLSRLHREPELARKVFAVPDDLDIFRTLLAYRYLTVEMLGRLLDRNSKSLHRRLAQLWHHSYLERFSPFEKPIGIGWPKVVYALGPGGAAALQDAGVEADFSGVRDRIRHDARLGIGHLQHRLLVSRFQLLLELACREHGGYRQLFFRRDLEDRSLAVKIRVPGYQNQVAVWPDAFFGLQSDGEPSRHFFLEAETEAGVRRATKRVEAKLRAYQALRFGSRALLARTHRIESFSVLYFCVSTAVRDRLVRIVGETEGLNTKFALFWFLTSDNEALFLKPERLFEDGAVVGPGGRPGKLIAPVV